MAPGRLVLVFAFVLMGCSGGGGGGSIPIVELGEEVEQALCEVLARCGGMPDVETCLSVAYVEQAAGLEELAAAVENGTVEYDAALAADCVDRQRNVPCTYSGTAGADWDECEAVFTGTVAKDGACSLDEQCLSRSCEVGDGCDDEAECCVGTCADASFEVPIGGDCTDFEVDCARGSYCDPDTSTCAARRGNGETCNDPSACEEDLRCAGFDFETNSGTCTPLVGEGEDCDPDEFVNCDRLDDYCDPTTRKCEKRKQPGGDCTEDDGVRECVDWAVCENGTCVAQPDSIGDTCDPEGDGCLGDLDCSESGQCAAPAPERVCPPPG